MLAIRHAETREASAVIFGKLFQDGKNDTLTVGELCVVLDHIRQLCASAGAKGSASDLEAISKALAPHAKTVVNAFCADARTKLGQQHEKPKGRKRASASVGASASNDAAIREHVMQLRDAGTNSQAFEAAFERLKGDKDVKSPDVAEIARQYSTSVTKYKSIKAAHTDIEKAFVRQARFENKLR